MSKTEKRKRLQRWEAFCGASCFVAGIVAPVLGMCLLSIEWLAGIPLESWLHVVATTLLVVGIPLILFAGFCLDWAEAKSQGPQSDRTSNKHGVLRLVPIVAVVVLSGGTQQAEGQQTIFNVPTTDVLDKGKVYLELDASLKPTDGAVVPKFSSFVPRVVVGTGNEVEVGLNITGNVQPGPDSTTLVPTVKWKPFSNENNGWALVVGDHVLIPVRNRSYHVGNYGYAEMSKTFEKKTRITFGGYHFTHDVVATAQRAGGQFGFEQPVTKTVTLAADWFTGKHAAGFFTPGMIFKVGPRVTGYASYSIGNTNLAGGNHFFLLEIGYSVN